MIVKAVMEHDGGFEERAIVLNILDYFLFINGSELVPFDKSSVVGFLCERGNFSEK